jgi:3',5'-nucleoside bisphosphate phosphatase
MRWYKADLHVHTVLSPCGDLDMSPVNIIRRAVEKNLEIIAITDHNSTKHCDVTRRIGEKHGITVIAGAELNTREEIHCLAFFENTDQTDEFQRYIDVNLTVIPNNPAIFGHQFIVDEQENILAEEERLLIAALQTGIEEVEKEVHRLNGLFVPAHINRMHNGIYGQLGFLPPDFRADALEVARVGDYRTFIREHPETGNYHLICSSDAHYLEQIGTSVTEFYLEKPDFEGIRQALKSGTGEKIKRI